MCSAVWHIPFSIIKKCLLRPIRELPSTVWKKVARTTVIKHCQNWLWPWMKFNFFIYYPKMPSGPYYTSRQPTSRIYMLRPSKAGYFLTRFRVLGFQVAQLVTNSPAMRETGVRSLSGEEPLEKAKAPTPVFWPGEPHGLHRPWGCGESDAPERLSLSPLQITINCTHAKKRLKGNALFTL